MNPLKPHNWSALNPLQVGRYGEYLTKMEFVLRGCDVFTSEVDDHGIDLVVRTKAGIHYDVQVKAVRRDTSYVFVEKSKFDLSPQRLLALVRLVDGQPPALFLVQAACELGVVHPVFVDRKYEGKKSDPEWGLNLSKKKLAELQQQCEFHATVSRLFGA